MQAIEGLQVDLLAFGSTVDVEPSKVVREFFQCLS